MHVLRVRHRLRAPAAGGAGTLCAVIAPTSNDLTHEQRAVVDAAFDRCIAVTGVAGSGKSTALRARAARAVALDPAVRPLCFPLDDRFDVFAAQILRQSGSPVTLIDDVEAEASFAGVCESLFALDWEEFVTDQLDPEVPGLRSPERFADSAFRLIRRLRDANVEPDEFLLRSLRGATDFYANPPNFADPALLMAVKETYHDSLAVTAAELARQYRREIDLAKILAKLYTRYCESARSSARMTGRDAVAAAPPILGANGELRAQLRATHRVAFVDDAQDLTQGEFALLQALYGRELAGVTLCGDAASAISTSRVTDPAAVFGHAGERFELAAQFRSPTAIELACRRLIAPEPIVAHGVETRLGLFRAPSVRAEAAFVAQRVRDWIDEGTPPERIAVLFRSIRHIQPYEAALLDRDVTVATGGDVNIFADRRALDALALLWNAHDPFRHDWLLRTLANPAFGLSDASLATLCAEPPSPQRPLFVFDDEPAPTTRTSRWDAKRDLRLGWNVVRGDQDGALSSDARARIERFRALRAGWVAAMHERPFDEFARRVWHDGLAREGTTDSARARAQQLVLRRLLERLTTFARGSDASVAEVLAYAGHRADSDLEACEDAVHEPGVRVLGVDATRGREFDRVIVADVRAGAFPRWYSPDAFLFSPRLGMIPKENAGDARAARTAKFSYYLFRNRSRERYNDRERRAFAYALRRARVGALVTAAQTPTKGVAAPEFLEELRVARLPGTQCLP